MRQSAIRIGRIGTMEGNSSYDVIVVGAGPAGTGTARRLAQSGINTLILERHAWPRRKLCGGGLTPKTYRHLGLDIEDLVKRKCDRVYLRAGKTGPLHVCRDDMSIWMVDREDLDVRLLEDARAQGAQFIDGVAVRGLVQSSDVVEVVTDKGPYRGKVVVGADGFDSVVAQAAGLRQDRNRKYSLALQTEIRPKRDSLGSTAVVDFGFPSGYAWVFPKDDRYSVGVGTADPRKFKELPKYLDRFIAVSGFEEATKTPYRGHKIPFGGSEERLHNGKVLLVGDAAGMADPLLGEGISYALKSGELAAGVIEDYLNGKTENLESYTGSVHRTIVRDFHSLRNVAFFVHHFPRLAVRIIGASRGLQNVAAAVISGDRSYSGMWRQT